MDILLINAPINTMPMAKGTAIPLGLAYLCAYLKQKWFTVGCLDMAYEKYEENEFKQHLLKHQPKIVGISFTTHSRFQIVKIVKIIRQTLPCSHITLGGHHVTNAPVDAIRNIDVNSLILGDGEETFLQLALRLFDSNNKIDEKYSIAGLILKSKENVNLGNLLPEVLSNLDRYPWPDRDAFDTRKYNLVFPFGVSVNAHNTEYLITSRGCPYACRFCSTYLTHGKNRIRYRKIVNIVDEIEFLIKVRKCDGLYIYDDNFTLSVKRIKDFASEMKSRKIFIPFVCYGRVDSVSYDSFRLLRDVGLQSVSFGIESGSKKVLKYLNKNITNEQTINAIKICDVLGIVAKGTFIVGSPEESLYDFQQTLRLIYKLKRIHRKFVANIGLSGLFIYPGTGVFSDAIKNRVLPEGFSWFKEYPRVRENVNVPIYFDPNINILLSSAPVLCKIYKAKYLLFHEHEELLEKLKIKFWQFFK